MPGLRRFLVDGVGIPHRLQIESILHALRKLRLRTDFDEPIAGIAAEACRLLTSQQGEEPRLVDMCVVFEDLGRIGGPLGAYST